MSLLTKTLQLSRLKGAVQSISRFLNTNVIKPPTSPAYLLNININHSNKWIYKQPEIIENPCTTINSIKLPNGIIWIPQNNLVPTAIEAPSSENTVQEKQAARLIVIRRKKMKKHKLRKLRKRMKFEWAKIRQRRELKKEKDFQAILIQQCKVAESFSAEKYVEERLSKLHELIIPKTWKGRRLPEFLIRQKMGLPPK